MCAALDASSPLGCWAEYKSVLALYSHARAHTYVSLLL